ncbi:phosphotransferase, partial [Candidatus Peregrinibacteria bacterium]|nr:phosphotransferase [Candidatus Peregrinibacteria bacterium]
NINHASESDKIYEEFSFLKEHKEFLGEMSRERIIGIGSKGIIIQMFGSSSVVKLAVDEDSKLKLDAEYRKHNAFSHILREGKRNDLVPSWVKIPTVSYSPHQLQSHFFMQRVIGQSLHSRFIRDTYNRELSENSSYDLDSMSDYGLKYLLMSKYSIDEGMIDTAIESATDMMEKYFPQKNIEFQKTLNFLLEQGLKHTDLHAGNVMIDRNENIYIIDFDSVKIIL